MRRIKVCIAGSRSFVGTKAGKIVEQEMEAFLCANPDVVIEEVISGTATGADKIGEVWAVTHGIPINRMSAKWNDLTAPNARIKINQWGKKYNANAGHDRNKKMAQTADIIFVFWDGYSPGSKQMIEYCTELGKELEVILISSDLS